MEFSLARQRFLQEVRQPQDQINLEKAALYLAQEEYPDLAVEDYLNALDGMADEVRKLMPSDRYPLRMVKTINQYLYEDLGFTGNQTDYYDPRNSFLNEVIDRRTGIPITLALVYLAIAKRLDFPMVGIAMPGHFLIRPDVEEMDLFVDAFNRGEVLFPEDCSDRLRQIYGQPIEMRPEFLATVAPRQFLARMLTNLKLIYYNRNEIGKFLATVERILILYPDAPFELRDRGVLFFQINRWVEAKQDLEQYLDLVPQADDRTLIQSFLDKMEQNA